MHPQPNDLQAGFQILWYQIHSVLGRGGFGITYLAEDTNLGQMVAIKEYLPQDYASRGEDSTVQPISIDHDDVYAWGLERFMSEAQTLAKFEHNNIVRILSVFQQNNTGYMVMKYEQGRDLSDIYEEKQQITQTDLEQIFLPIMDGLKTVHAGGFIHRDIKPSNIYIRDNGSPVLLDFGAARQAVGSKTRTLTAMLSVGYAPFEQYNENSDKQGPWTDIYALGASMYQGITGEKPVDSSLRSIAFMHNEPDPYYPLSFSPIKNFSPDFLRAIDGSLMLQINDRPQSIDEFVAMLKGDVSLTRLQPSRYAMSQSSKTVIKPGRGGDSFGRESGDQSPLRLVANENGKKVARSSNSNKPVIKITSIIGGLIIMALAGYLLIPAELSPEQEKQQEVALLLEKAGEYLEQGVYFNKQSDNALTAYRSILSIDPENTVAIDGLGKIAGHFLLVAKNSIDQNKLDVAEEHLSLVRSIDSAYPGVKEASDSLSSVLRNEELSKQVAILLEEARMALSKEQVYLPLEDSAYRKFQKVLELDATNEEARNGLSTVARTVVSDATVALKQEKTNKAESLLALVERIEPDAPEIKELRNELNVSSRIDTLIAQADSAYARQRYTTPESENAVQLYNKVLEISPANTHAREMLKKMADFYIGKVRRDTRAGKFVSAHSGLNTLETRFTNESRSPSVLVDLSREIEKNQVFASIKHLLPAGINQNQAEHKIIEDIYNKFSIAFGQKDISSLKEVSKLNSQMESFFAQIFNLYKNVNIELVGSSIRNSTAELKLQMVKFVDQKGKRVQADADWTRIRIALVKENGYWYKGNVENW